MRQRLNSRLGCVRFGLQIRNNERRHPSVPLRLRYTIVGAIITFQSFVPALHHGIGDMEAVQRQEVHAKPWVHSGETGSPCRTMPRGAPLSLNVANYRLKVKLLLADAPPPIPRRPLRFRVGKRAGMRALPSQSVIKEGVARVGEPM
jgi:hypothetical protein